MESFRISKMSEFTRKAAKTDYELLNTRKVIREKISDIDWQSVTYEMNENGYSWCHNSFMINIAKKLLTNTITPSYIARPLQWRDIALD